MAFTPYKTGRNPDIYAKYDKKRQSGGNKLMGRVKIFGFRSGVAYKMVPAILYYAFAWFYIGTAIYGEFQFLELNSTDVVLDIFKYIFFAVILFSPALFLSDFKYIDSLPLFKKKQVGSSIIGLILVWMFCYFMMNVNIYCMSDVYKESVRNYDAIIEKQQELRNKNKEKETTTGSETVTVGKADDMHYQYETNTLYL